MRFCILGCIGKQRWGGPPPRRKQLDGDYRFAREQDCDLRLFDFESFGGFGKEVRSTLKR